MDFTRDQISELLLDIANSNGGTHLLLQLTLNAFMKAERTLHQANNIEEQGNGYRFRKAIAQSKELVLKVPRTRSGAFYPALLAVLRDEDEERRKLIFSLYSKGLTTLQVGDVFEEVYGKTYSKQQISYLMKESRQEVSLWLNRRLESHYLAIYIDATFVHTRRNESVSKEAYYTILGIKEDGCREVLCVVNHPTEGALQWQQELINLQTRGVQSVGLVISDALQGIEDAVASVFPESKHQFCVVHFTRKISSVFPLKERKKIYMELNDIFKIETKEVSAIESFDKLCIFTDKYSSKYPSLKRIKNIRNIAYFTYLQYPIEIQRMIYTTNWIERLNRDYKRVIKMRGALPSPESVLALLGAVAMEKERTTYAYPVYAFREVEELRKKEKVLYDESSATLHLSSYKEI